MANSMMNPLIYAWKNASFRHAFSKLLTCRKPDQGDGMLTVDSPTGKTSKATNSRNNVNDLQCRTSTSRMSQTSVDSTTHSNGPEITYISTIHDESVQNHTIQVALNTTSEPNVSSITGIPRITTHIIKGNVIINNYNLYDSFLDVRNHNQASKNDSSKTDMHECAFDCKQQTTDGLNQNDKNDSKCDRELGINNAGFQENITKL